MLRVIMVTVLVLLGCGDPLMEAVKDIGDEANRARKSASDAGMSINAVNEAIDVNTSSLDTTTSGALNKAASDIEAEAVRASKASTLNAESVRGYLTSRSITLVDAKKRLKSLGTTIKEKEGAAEDYVSSRWEDINKGDIETTTKVGSLEKENAEQADRIAALEAADKVQAVIIATLASKSTVTSAVEYLQAQFDAVHASLTAIGVALSSFSDGQDGETGAQGPIGETGATGQPGPASCTPQAAYTIVVNYVDYTARNCGHHSCTGTAGVPRTLSIPIQATVCPT